MNGRSKCTWQFISEDNTVAPTIKLTDAPFTNFLFYWVEWIQPAGLGSGGILPATSAANYFLGDYAVADGVFINPVTFVTDSGTNWVQSAITFSYSDLDPSRRIPGSIGDAVYYSRANGPFKSTQALKMDQPILSDKYAHFKAAYDSFATVVGAYNSKKDEYNNAVKKEQARKADLFQFFLSPPVAIPQRPCPPNQPMAYSGPAMKLSDALSATPAKWTDLASKTDNTAYLGVGSTHMPTVAAATRYGYLTSTSDDSQATQPTGSVGHVFGRLGQGDATLHSPS